jgi:hypothetical protein
VEGQGTQTFQVITHIEPHNGRTYQDISFFTTPACICEFIPSIWRVLAVAIP